MADTTSHTRKKKLTSLAPRNRIAQYLADDTVAMTQFNCSQSEILGLLPKKWEKFGDVVIIKRTLLAPQIASNELLLHRMAIAFSRELSVTCVALDEAGIGGELRTPTSLTILLNEKPTPTPTPPFLSRDPHPEIPVLEVSHTENHVTFYFDVARVMFSSGNGTERMRMAQLDPVHRLVDETVLDMFAGIGYFSVPLSVFNCPRRHICIEKNPVSHYYLNKNFAANKISAVELDSSQGVSTVLGDNREVGNSFVGCVDRILMGYLPTPKEFLVRAFDFLKPKKRCIVHYHHLCKKAEIESMAIPRTHFAEELVRWSSLRGITPPSQPVFEVLSIHTVKSYAPQLYHCVADVAVTLPPINNMTSPYPVFGFAITP